MDEAKITLCQYRLEKAERCILSAAVLLDDDDYNGSANRAYYSVFHGVRAILALDGVDFSKHSGVISYFQREYVKTKIFSKEYAAILQEAFALRSDSDYDDYFEFNKEEAESLLKDARFFLNGIENYIKLERNV